MQFFIKKVSSEECSPLAERPQISEGEAVRPLWVLPAGLVAPCHLCPPGILPLRALLPGVWARDVVFQAPRLFARGLGAREAAGKPAGKDLEVLGA